MVSEANLLIIVLGFLCFCLLVFVLKLLHKLWWTPIRFQSFMRMQGISGPSYIFLHGNTKEMLSMRKRSLSVPMVGLSNDIFSKVQPHVQSWINVYGMNYLFWIGPRAQLVVTESELIKEILNNKNNVYPKAKPQPYLKKLLGDGLVTSGGEKWAKSRKLANYAFHGESLKNMIPEMIASVEMMLERWEEHCDGKEIEVFEEFRLLTSEVISRTAFGSSYFEGKDIFEMLNNLVLMMSRNAFKQRLPFISNFWKTSDDIEAERLEKGIHDSIIKIIKKRKEKMSSGEVDNYGTDFLGLLVNAFHDADESKMIPVEDMIDECKTFYVAGQETTNTLLSWTVFLLASHTDWQEEARKEVLKLFSGQTPPNPDGIAKLKTMGMIINETLRLYPPVTTLTRRLQRDVRLANLTLPVDLNLQIPIIKLHTDPQLWGQDAHLFKPERFSEGVAKATNNNATAFFPFGIGPRTCVGINFAVTEAKIVLSMILQRYAFTLSPSYIHSPIQVITVRPQHGMQVLLHKL